MSTEQQELVQRVGGISQPSSILPSSNNSTSSGANCSSSSSREVSGSSPRLIPVKSFQNTLLNMSVSRISSNRQSSLTYILYIMLYAYL